jgi:hypothetical protein
VAHPEIDVRVAFPLSAVIGPGGGGGMSYRALVDRKPSPPPVGQWARYSVVTDHIPLAKTIG